MTTQILLPPSRRVRAGDWNSKKLPGSSKAQIILDEQGEAWVVKSINSPQGHISGMKTSFNDYLAGRMLELLGLPVAEVALMEIDEDFLDNYYPQLRAPEYGSFNAGFHFACKFHQGCFTLRDINNLGMLTQLQDRCANRQVVNDMAAFDSCVANWDRANVLLGGFAQNLDNILFQQTAAGMSVLLIDHGWSFAGDWNTAHPPTAYYTVGHWPQEVFGVYHDLTRLGWYTEAQIQTGVDAMQRISLRSLHDIVDEIPTSWKLFTTQTSMDTMLVHLTQRISTYHAVVAQAFAPTHARALAG